MNDIIIYIIAVVVIIAMFATALFYHPKPKKK